MKAGTDHPAAHILSHTDTGDNYTITLSSHPLMFPQSLLCLEIYLTNPDTVTSIFLSLVTRDLVTDGTFYLNWSLPRNNVRRGYETGGSWSV